MSGERTRIALTSLALVLDCVQGVCVCFFHSCLHHMHIGKELEGDALFYLSSQGCNYNVIAAIINFILPFLTTKFTSLSTQYIFLLHIF